MSRTLITVLPCRHLGLMILGLVPFVAACARENTERPLSTMARNREQREPVRESEERRLGSGRSLADRSEVAPSPAPAPLTPEFDSERLWSGQDDWEPHGAADPSSDYVYQLTTRLTPAIAAIAFRRSSDNGATWEPDQLLHEGDLWQYDPQIQVADDGTIYALWLGSPDYDTQLVKSFDHGDTWTEPLSIASGLPWTDHAWLVISPDGRDVYIGLNFNNSYMVTSHDFGATFGKPIQTSRGNNRWWLHTGGDMAPDGSVYFAVVDYAVGYGGDTHINVVATGDGGTHWTTTLLDTSKESPECDWAAGCTFGFMEPTAGLAVDGQGKIMVAYHAGLIEKEPQPLFVTTSVNGSSWTSRFEISHFGSNNMFPAVGAGPESGDFRVVWQGDADGDTNAWNTYYRRTTDGGATWGPIVRLSDLGRGAPYKTREGYEFTYGDYLGLSVDSDGTNHIIWGESGGYNGPGGTWYTRGGES